MSNLPKQFGRYQPLAMVALVLLGLGSCGTDDRPTKKGGPITADGFWEARAMASCQVRVRCGLEADVDGCVDMWMLVPRTMRAAGVPDAVITAIQDGRVTYDATAAQRCVDAILAEDCFAHEFSVKEQLPGCADAYVGTIANGGSCAFSEECQAGTLCAPRPPQDRESSCVDSTCQRDEVRCNLDRDCAAGHRCDVRGGGDGAGRTPSSSGTCVPSVPPGGPMQRCGVNMECQPGLHCAWINAETPEESGSFCHPLHAAGDSCGDSQGIVAPCVEGLTCVYSDDGSSETCMPPAGKGEPCVGNQCDSFLLSCDERTHRCVDAPSSGICHPNLSGEHCNHLTSWCHAISPDEATCEAYVPLGGDCSGARQCIPGLFCMASGTAGAMTCQGFAGCL